MRLFIALEIPPVLRDGMAIMSRQLRERIQGRFIPPENYHITLAFIGETLEMSIPLAIDAIDEATKNLDGILLKPTSSANSAAAKTRHFGSDLRRTPNSARLLPTSAKASMTTASSTTISPSALTQR